MATLDLSKAKFAFYMTDPDLVSFGANDGAGTPTGWSYLTTGGDDVLVKGTGMTFDAAGRPTSGTATSIEIDVGNDDPGNPELVITGINVAAASLDDGPASFWRFLEGDDVILGPELAQGRLGRDVHRLRRRHRGAQRRHRRPGRHPSRGRLRPGRRRRDDVGSQAAGAPTADYRGGNDELLGLFSDRHQIVSGDAFAVYAGSRLTGGNDSIVLQSTYSGSSAVGDAYNVAGTAGALARLVGGNDYISAAYGGTLYGDVFTLQSHGFVQGGADTINGGISNNIIVGDVYRMTSATWDVIGGDDVIDGGGGDDTISGDVYSAHYLVTSITGGDDVIRGGVGNDRIYGDSTDNNLNAAASAATTGSMARTATTGSSAMAGMTSSMAVRVPTSSGAAMATTGSPAARTTTGSYGGNGNDQLDGGAGADAMYGGAGNDTYYVNSSGDVVQEEAGAGIDTVWSTLAAPPSPPTSRT